MYNCNSTGFETVVIGDGRSEEVATIVVNKACTNLNDGALQFIDLRVLQSMAHPSQCTNPATQENTKCIKWQGTSGLNMNVGGWGCKFLVQESDFPAVLKGLRTPEQFMSDIENINELAADRKGWADYYILVPNIVSLCCFIAFLLVLFLVPNDWAGGFKVQLFLLLLVGSMGWFVFGNLLCIIVTKNTLRDIYEGVAKEKAAEFTVRDSCGQRPVYWYTKREVHHGQHAKVRRRERRGKIRPGNPYGAIYVVLVISSVPQPANDEDV